MDAGGPRRVKSRTTPCRPALLLLLPLVAACARVGAPYEVPAVTLAEPAGLATVEAHTQSPILGGNRATLLLNGDAIFPAMLEAIQSATRTITLAQYYYEDGSLAARMAAALAERCGAGVRVHVLLDGVGALAAPREHVERLERAGCAVGWFRPIRPWTVRRVNNRMHRRILVVDGRVGFTGGSGIGDKWLGDGRTADHWRETDVRVEGPAVRQLQTAFAESWREVTGHMLAGDAYFPRLEAGGPLPVQVVWSSPASGSFEAYLLFMLAIESSRRSILITNPYFVPDDRMADALLRAARRGVRVVALVPGQIDHNIVRHASRRGFGPLLPPSSTPRPSWWTGSSRRSGA
jgi:cardiolipin synthase